MKSEEWIKNRRDIALYWQAYWERKQNYEIADMHKKEAALYAEVLEGDDEIQTT